MDRWLQMVEKTSYVKIEIALCELWCCIFLICVCFNSSKDRYLQMIEKTSFVKIDFAKLMLYIFNEVCKNFRELYINFVCLCLMCNAIWFW